MEHADQRWRALISSDWNECLAPCGPFDVISFCFPSLKPETDGIFRQYTGNEISLKSAVSRISRLLPEPVTEEMMDAYLSERFTVYNGVPGLIDWCLENNILFMINTTGMTGYFQRIWANGLLPRIPVLSANPLIRFPGLPSDPPIVLDLFETTDKGKNTSSIMERYNIPACRLAVMGDSGGDGPHFRWAYSLGGACLIGSMTKPSLEGYCLKYRITIDKYFGVRYGKGMLRDEEAEMEADFTEMIPLLGERLLGKYSVDKS